MEKLLRLELDLADALARHAPALADLLERAWVILLEPVVDDVPGQLADPLPDLAERVADLTVPLGEEVRVLRAGPSSSIRSRWVASPSSSIGLSSDRSGCATVPLLGRTVDRAAFRYFPMYARIHQTAYVEKRVPAVRVELLDRAHEADVAFLDDIVEADRAAALLARDGDDERQVVPHELLLRPQLAVPGANGERVLPSDQGETSGPLGAR